MELEQSFVKLVNDVYGKENFAIIEKAFRFAEKKHAGDKRDTGEDYIIHPYHVGKYLAEMHADVETVVSGFLHDCIEDTDCKPEEIKKEFGDVVYNICVGASKIEPIKHARREHQEESENLRKMFLTQLLLFAEEDILFKKIIVNVFKASHEAFYKQWGFSFVKEHIHSGRIYELELKPYPDTLYNQLSKNRHLKDVNEKLKEIYGK